MVEEILTIDNKPPKTSTSSTITTRPKPVYLWSVADVQKWFNRLCGDYIKYSQNFLNNNYTALRKISKISDQLRTEEKFFKEMFKESILRHQNSPRSLLDMVDGEKHEITGRALLRMTDNSLLRMGIQNNRDREAIWREIVKLRLKTDIMEIKDFELMNIYYE